MSAAATPAIRVQGLGKTYQLVSAGPRPSTVAEALVSTLKSRGKRARTSFEALDDVTFDVDAGQALGIVGRNGAGKSTLLKLLTRITAPSRGSIELRGRVGSLLEVGTGFHPELTGRENIYLNGSLLGMTRSEIQRRFDEIVEFSGVEKFLGTPVKRYSSGMYVRLAFAVAAHLDTEILAIDEVLAVGDAEFQQKSLAKMRDAARDGRTVLYVSHQVQTVKALCTSAVLLERGRLIEQGSVETVLNAYHDSFERFAAAQRDPDERGGSGQLRLRSVEIEGDYVRSGDDVVIGYSVGTSDVVPGKYYLSCHVNDTSGMVIAQCDSRLVGGWFDPGTPNDGKIRIRNLWLKPGTYTIDMFVCQSGTLDSWDAAGRFEVPPDLPFPEMAEADGTAHGVIFADFCYEERVR